jgi:hypothetical protein
MYKTFTSILALLTGLISPAQATSPAHQAQVAPEIAPLQTLGPSALVDCALGCGTKPLSLIVPPNGEPPLPPPAGLALSFAVALALLLVKRRSQLHHLHQLSVAADGGSECPLEAETSALASQAFDEDVRPLGDSPAPTLPPGLADLPSSNQASMRLRA